MDEATRFAEAVASGDYASAYEMGGEVLREKRSLEQFTSDMKRWGFDRPGSVEWTKGNNALPAKNGYKLMGSYTAADGESFPVYVHLEGDAHVDPQKRVREWTPSTKWTVMDYRSGESMRARIMKGDGSATPLDWFLLVCAGLSKVLVVFGFSTI